MRAHGDVPATGLHPYTEPVLDPRDPLVEGCRGDDQVIEFELGGRPVTRRRHAAGAAACLGSSAAKSSSTRAPFGSKKNTCHVPAPTSRRQVCAILRAV